MTDHLAIASRYLAAVEEKLTSTGYDTDAEMRTDALFGLSHAMVDIAHSLRALASPTPAPEPAKKLGEHITRTAAAPVAAEAPARGNRPQLPEKRTCEICSRVGTRRFVRTTTGWKCSPTAACKRTPLRLPPEKDPTVKHGTRNAYGHLGCRCELCCEAEAERGRQERADRKELADTTLAKVASTTALSVTTPGVTARCQDCTRTFTLAGRVL